VISENLSDKITKLKPQHVFGACFKEKILSESFAKIDVI